MPPPSALIVGSVLFFGFAALSLALRRKQPAKSVFSTKYRRRDVMTRTELTFFRRLIQAFPSVVIAPQVAMAALVDVASKRNQGEYVHANRAKISQRRLDFVLFDRHSGKALCVIELDDHTHDSDKARAKDSERDAILASAGYPVYRFDARQMPSASDIRACIR